MRLGRIVGFVVGAVLTVAVGYAIAVNIPPLFRLMNTRFFGGE
jgi:hypothetical protein